MSMQVDTADLESKVKAMYREVAENPRGEFHFEMGRAMAERLGYLRADLDRIPAEAIESFAGVGYYFHLLDELDGARVLDLGSGSGMDSFIASLKTGPSGTVIGLDMTVTATVTYTLVERATGKTAWEKVIVAPYTAKFGDSLLGVERLKLANEGAIRTNISNLLDDLYRLRL